MLFIPSQAKYRPCLENTDKTCKSQHISLDDAPDLEVTVLSCCVAMVAAPQLEPASSVGLLGRQEDSKHTDDEKRRKNLKAFPKDRR